MHHVRFLKGLIGKLFLVAVVLSAMGLYIPDMGAQVVQGAPVPPAEIGLLYTACSGERIDAVEYIDTDTTWTLASSPRVIGKHIEVLPGATLTIEPGVEAWVSYKRYIHVCSGATIIAKGTPDQHIVFTRYTPNEGPRWNKMWFHSGSTSYFRYTDFSYGGASASSDDTILHFEETGTHILNNCSVEASKEQGIVASGSGLDLTIAGTRFARNGRRSIMVDNGATLTVQGSLFEDESDAGIYLRSRPALPTITIRDSNFAGPLGIYNQMDNEICIDAQENWWGSIDGPAGGGGGACRLGGNGGSGADIGRGVDYRNWLTSEPPLQGITTSPVATFTVSPDPTVIQPLGTAYEFDASGTTDAEDYVSSLEVCWDWDANGECDTNWTTDKTATRSFDGGSATQTVRLFVRDTDGDTSEATQDIALNTPPEADLTVTPDPGTPQREGTEYKFDASDSSDKEDSTADLEVCWDWDNNGECDTAWVKDKTNTHSFTYEDGAEQLVRLVVRDTADATDDITETIHVLENLPPTTTFTISRTTWNAVEFDASATTDDDDDPDDLQLAWDYEGNGDHTSYADFTGAVTKVYTYPHQGRYWPALYAKDTGDKEGMARQTLDILPPSTSATLTGTTDALTSVDSTVQITMSVDESAKGGTLLLYGIVVTHTPQLTPVHDGLDNDWLYQGFTLDAYSMLGDQPINAISGTYTITLSYDEDYFANVLGLPFEEKLMLYRWVEDEEDTLSYWAPVNSTLSRDDDRLVAITSDFGDFALVMDISQIYLPLVTRSN